jgi:multidrug resistance protein
VRGSEAGADRNPGKSPTNLGKVVIATDVIIPGPDPRSARNVILLLAASVGLMMTGFGIILPVFARRLDEFGSGVEALGLMTLSFALAQFVAAPFMGTLADRLGRRPLVLAGLAAFFAANIGFLFANSTTAFLVIRIFEGALTAGLFPAAMGVVADVVPRGHRARWVGIVMGSYGAGLIFGPVLGGFLYDTSGYAAPFVASAIMALIALMAAAITMPETRTPEVRWREKLRNRRAATIASTEGISFWASLPRPLYLFFTLLILDFILVFAFAFVEPQMVFYFYDDLGWTSVQFGLVIGVYGTTMVLGQGFLGQLSDKYGRKSIIVWGTLLELVFYIGLVFLTSFPLMLLASAISGLGTALIEPALNSYYLDITDERYRSRILGIKESSVAMGGVAGPMLLVLLSAFISAKGIFIIATLTVLGSAVLAIIALPVKEQGVGEPKNVDWEASEKRALAAQSALRGIVLRATAARDVTKTTYASKPTNR